MKRYPAYKDSGVEWIGEIPEHWVLKKIKHIGHLAAGVGFPYENQGVYSEELPFYKVSDMNSEKNSVFMASSNHSVSRKIAKELGAKIFSSGDIIFPKSRCSFINK